MSSLQGTNDHALLVEDIEMKPLHRIDMVVAGDRAPGSGNLLRAHLESRFNLQDEPCGDCIKPCLDSSPSLPKTLQLSKSFLRCLRPASSCGGQVPPPIALDTKKNRLFANSICNCHMSKGRGYQAAKIQSPIVIFYPPPGDRAIERF